MIIDISKSENYCYWGEVPMKLFPFWSLHLRKHMYSKPNIEHCCNTWIPTLCDIFSSECRLKNNIIATLGRREVQN